MCHRSRTNVALQKISKCLAGWTTRSGATRGPGASNLSGLRANQHAVLLQLKCREHCTATLQLASPGRVKVGGR